MTIYNPTQKILIVRTPEGKILKAFGGPIATKLWHDTLNKYAENHKN